MSLLLTKYDNTSQTMIIVPLTLSPSTRLCLLLLVRHFRLHSEFVCLLFFTGSSKNWLFFYNFRSSSSACVIYQWLVPPPTLGVLLTAQIEGRQLVTSSSRLQHCGLLFFFHDYSFWITHSPITLSNLSRLLWLTSSLSLGVPVTRATQCVCHCVRRADPSSWALSSHRHSYISILFISHFISSMT
jgi:hypothetical protein